MNYGINFLVRKRRRKVRLGIPQDGVVSHVGSRTYQANGLMPGGCKLSE
jgi:hypothetical protein